MGRRPASGAKIVAALRQRVPILGFHDRWIRSVFRPDVQIGVLSCPRGSAKTWIAGQLAALAMRPGSPLWRERVETLGVSASLEQSRVFLAMVREALDDIVDDYRWMTSGQRLQATHKATGTRLRILSSSGRRAMGLEGFGTIFADEPGAWEVRGGQLMFDALRQSLGKRADQRLVLIGTRSPAPPASWWPNLIDGGSGPGTHVSELSAPVDQPWDSWLTIRRVNPLVMFNQPLRKTILRERDEARRCPDDSMRMAFEAYRLNRQVRAHADVLVTVPAWRRVESRDVPAREGKPVVGPGSRIQPFMVGCVGSVEERSKRVLRGMSWSARSRRARTTGRAAARTVSETPP